MSEIARSAPVDLWLMRHTESLRNAGMRAARCGDRKLFDEVCKIANIDCPLSPTGRSQTMIIAARMKLLSLQFDGVYVSDFLRTQEMLNLLRYPFQKVIQDSRLNERSHGISENMMSAEFMRYVNNHPQECARYWCNPFKFAFREGESFLDVRSRVKPWYLEFLVSDCTSGLVISHTDVMRVLIMIIERRSEAQFEAMLRAGFLKIKNGDIYHYTRRNPWDGKMSEAFCYGRRWSPLVSAEFGPWKVF